MEFPRQGCGTISVQGTSHSLNPCQPTAGLRTPYSGRPMPLHLLPRQLVSGSAFIMAFVFLVMAFVFLVLFGVQLQAQVPANSIHPYADAAACQMGAREGHYLPLGIKPNSVNDLIPMFWNQYGLIWQPDPVNNGQGEFLLTGPPPVSGAKDCSKTPCEIGMDFPEPGANGPFKDPYDSNFARPKHLRCDHFPYVEPSCTPGQLVKDLYQGTCGRASNAKACQSSTLEGLSCADGSACVDVVHWRVLFRRTAASAKDNCTMAGFKPECTEYYPTVDADGLRVRDAGNNTTGTFAVAWLDSVGCDAPGCGSGARDFNNGFRNGQLMPRPGGKRPALRPEGMRATKWYDDSKLISSLPGNSCNNCHGTPYNGDDWIRQKGGGIPRVNPADDQQPWWFAGNNAPTLAPLYPVKKIFKDDSSVDCDGCHRRWMEGAGSTPGGFVKSVAMFPFVRWMTMVHEAVGADLDENPFEGIDLASFQLLASSFRIDKPETTYLKKNAIRTHYMPPKHKQNTIADWDTAYNDQYNSVACCGAGLGQANGAAGKDCGRGVLGLNECPGDVQLPPGGTLACSKVTCDLIGQDQVVSLFQTPWMVEAKQAPQKLNATDEPNGIQPIAQPDAPESGSLQQVGVECPAGIGANPGDKCFKLTWNDPVVGEEFNAPQTFHYKQLDQMLQPNLNPVNFAYCTDSSKEPAPAGDPDDFTIVAAGAANPFFPVVNESPITTPCDATKELDCWRYKYETIGISRKCTRKTLHFCGGWCKQQIKFAGQASRSIVSTEQGQMLEIVNTNGLPKGALNLGDGMKNFHFNGTGTDQITVLIPPQYCNSGVCTMARGNANGTEDLQSSGTYIVSTLSNAPFSLTADADGSFMVNQTAQIQLSYTSPQGMLTGTLQLATVLGGQGSASLEGTFTATGGTFAQFFPAGGDLDITLGLTGSLESLVDHNGFLAAEFENGAVVPVAACMKTDENLAQGGLPKMAK
jgi:hypothetical protein